MFRFSLLWAEKELKRTDPNDLTAQMKLEWPMKRPASLLCFFRLNIHANDSILQHSFDRLPSKTSSRSVQGLMLTTTVQLLLLSMTVSL